MKKNNPIAKELRTPKYRKRVIKDKRQSMMDKEDNIMLTNAKYDQRYGWYLKKDDK